MGHVDQVSLGNDVEVSPNQYEVHLLFTCAVKLYARIMQHPERMQMTVRFDDVGIILLGGSE